MLTRIFRTYESIVLNRPLATLVTTIVVTILIGWQARYFALDASADSLTLENDAGLRYYREITARYGSDDYLIVTYTPSTELFGEHALSDLTALRDDLLDLPGVRSVTSILDVPLISSPPIDLADIGSDLRYLHAETTDRELAKRELLTSPLYRELLISTDGLTTALRIDMRQSEEFLQLRSRRDALRKKQASAMLAAEEEAELAEVTAAFDAVSRDMVPQQQQYIREIRDVLDAHRSSASLHLGGVPMIVADSIDFIRSDLVTFGAGVLLFLVVILALAFKKWRWVFLPLMTCAATAVFMFGLLGLVGWRITVVSSNFVALLLIMCLALTLHIIVRYRETHEQQPEADQMTLVSQTVKAIVMPCIYTALTTIVAFGSLLVSGIRPVIDFGWIMAIGIVVAFVYSFTLFPATLMLLPPGRPGSRNDHTADVTRFFASLVQRHSAAVVIVFTLFAIVGVWGATRLTIENRFIDYYRESTEIYQGMELIDRKLGGTTPLDVIIDAPAPGQDADEPNDVDDEFSEIFGDDADSSAGITSRSYWFNSWTLAKVGAMHDYLDSLPETGKVISLATLATMLDQLDEDILENNFDLSIVYERAPPDLRQELIEPYFSEEEDQLRFSLRVFESDPGLRRSKLLQQIRSDLVDKFELADEQIHLTGMLVLYNNMLQSLFKSQILTLGAVFFAISLMFLALFRSLLMAVTAIIPNLVSAIVVLGLMGWFGIPLDLMTITIAAITVGIGVDDTIHYVHRFRHEFETDRDYWATVDRCHNNIGRAIYYTSLTITLGFSILAFSRFVPTVFFGVLTGFAMFIALLANMALLPVLIVWFRAGGKPAKS